MYFPIFIEIGKKKQQHQRQKKRQRQNKKRDKNVTKNHCLNGL